MVGDVARDTVNEDETETGDDGSARTTARAGRRLREASTSSPAVADAANVIRAARTL